MLFSAAELILMLFILLLLSRNQLLTKTLMTFMMSC